MDRVLDSSHNESTYKTAVVQTTWQKEAMVVLKRLINCRKHGLPYAEPFMTPVDPIAYVTAIGTVSLTSGVRRCVRGRWCVCVDD